MSYSYNLQRKGANNMIDKLHKKNTPRTDIILAVGSAFGLGTRFVDERLKLLEASNGKGQI